MENISGANGHHGEKRKREVVIPPPPPSLFRNVKWASTSGTKPLILAAIECYSLSTSETMNLIEAGVMMTACNSISFMCLFSSPSTQHDLSVNCGEIWGSLWVLLGGLNKTPLTPPWAEVIHILNLNSCDLRECRVT